MAVTQNTYTGNGSTVLYSFTFPYLETTDIKVSVNGTVTTAYTLANATTIQFNTAPANGAAIRIYRQTDDAALAATFYPGSAIRSQDLNENFTQNLYVTQESTNNAATATTTANTALTNSTTAIGTANTALSTANTASSNASAAVATANTASSNASAAVSTANTASSSATAAVNTANAATATANSATSTANTALSTANAATSTANAASTAATNAVNTANAASSAANSAVSTANTASTNASNAVTTANTASTNATTAVNTANTAVTTANAAAAAVANAVLYTTVANVAAIPGSPTNNTAIEVTNSTGIESFTPLSGLPVGFVGSSGLSVRIIYQTVGSTWTWIQYFPNDPESRYLKLSGGTLTGQLRADDSTSVASPVIAFDGDTNTGVAHTGADELALVTGGSARLTIDGSGNVAVPGTLGVTGAITGSSTVTGTALIPTSSTVPTNGVYLPAANSVAISTNSVGRLFVDSIGNIGVGTSSPASNGSTFATLSLNGSNGGAQHFMNAGSTVMQLYNDANAFFVNAYTGKQVIIQTGGSERLRITSAGLVGVGTSVPRFALSLGATTPSSTATPTTIDLGGTYSSTAGANAKLKVYWDGSNEFGFGVSAGQMDYIAAATNGHGFFVGSTQVAKIDSSGRLGVGTSSVDGMLHVKGANTHGSLILEAGGTSGSTNQIYIQGHNNAGVAIGEIAFDETATNQGGLSFKTNGGSLTAKMTLTSGGSLGIGVASPDTLIHGRGGNLRIDGGATGSVFIAGTSTTPSDGVSLQSTYAGSGSYGPLMFFTSGSERFRCDSSGRLLVGTSTGTNNIRLDQKIAVVSTGGNFAGAALTSYGGTSASVRPVLDFNRSRGTTDGSMTAVAADDFLGTIVFRGSDGTQFVDGAFIQALVDGGVSTNDLPTRLVFSTTSDSASSPTERARITSSGFFKAKADTVYQSETGTYHEFSSNTSSTTVLNVLNKNASYIGPVLNGGADRSANSAYDFQTWYSAYSGTFDLEFRLRGDGNGLCDGAWTGGGADYAEYFEWSDSNPDAEDRRGISVVLDGDKIREAQAGEDPIGVISGNPSVVGDAAWNKWSGKYLRDEFGTYLLDENGDRQLNPAHDPDQKYIPREQRPEWDCVGLMGKLRIRKGQVTGSRWIKMRNISDSVEEWLVR